MNFVLGTVQFGLKYGYFHNNETVNEDDIDKIIKISEKNAINELDTASTYGKSELILSKKIINKKKWKFNTKIKHSLDEVIKEDYLNSIKRELDDSYNRFESLNIIYIHNPKDLFKKNADKIFYYLENLKKNKIISKIGCSLYNEKEIMHAIRNYSFDNLQIPINILDQRLLNSNILDKIKQKNSFKFDEAKKNFVFNFKINQNDFNLFYDPKKQELLMQNINGSIEVASKCEQQPYLTATISKYYGKIINKEQNDTQAQKEIAKEKEIKPTNEVAKVEKVKETKNQNLNTESLVIKASSPVKTKINHERAGYDVVCDNDFTFSQGGEVQFVDGNARLTFDLLKKKYLVEVFAEELVFKIRFNNSVYDVDNNFIGTIDDNSIFVDQNKIYFEAGEGNKGAFKFEYSILNNIFTTKFDSPEGSFDFKAICKTSPEFVKVFNQVYNPIISNQLNDSKTYAVSISKEDLKEKLQFYKDLYEEELITKEEYENVRKEILSGSINNTTASNQDAQINQVQGQLDLERQKLEEMKRQTQLAQQDLLEQKRIADEAAKQNRRNSFNDNMKSAKKGLCIMQTGDFLNC